MEAVFDDPRSHRRCSGRTGSHDETALPESLADSQISPGGNVVLTTRWGILPYGDVTEELSMKAPMSVSKPADLG